MKRIPLVKRIPIAFKNHRKELRDIWESYCLIETYMSIMHDRVKDGIEPTLSLKLIFGCDTKLYSKTDTYGALSSLRIKRNPRHTLIEAIAAFENYHSDLMSMVYRGYPNRLRGQQLSHQESPERTTKLLDVILLSDDKDEMISKLIEEKVRNIFYGSPADFFIKDKGKLGFEDFFEEPAVKPVIDTFIEATARRNLIMHNGGKVDRKYLREVENSQFRLGQIIPVSDEYLRRVIGDLECLSAAATNLVVKHVCKGTATGKLLDSLKKFQSRIK